MLIDQYLPEYDAVERHSIAVGAPAETIYAALHTADLAGAFLVRLLLALRGLPAALGPGGLRAWWRQAQAPVTLAAFEEMEFSLLAEEPPHELVLGLAGRFWTPTGDLHPVDAATFAAPCRPGTARAAWNFSIVPQTDGTCRLHTETRVQCADKGSRRRFRCYWLVVRPGSGFIRRLMLRSVKKEAEAERQLGRAP
ncbi:MAG: hypothetical protein GKR89_32720 [Candidatus Latescibacteria bacterium]|nr:hypothetical protein [Candidatus Latescibacterota bacterium]